MYDLFWRFIGRRIRSLGGCHFVHAVQWAFESPPFEVMVKVRCYLLNWSNSEGKAKQKILIFIAAIQPQRQKHRNCIRKVINL